MSKRTKISVITARFPYPLEKGDKLRAFHIIKNLSQNADIQLLSLNTSAPISDSQLAQLSPFCKLGVEVHNLGKFNSFFRILLAFFKSWPLQIGYYYSAKANTKIEESITKIGSDYILNLLPRTAEYGKNLMIPKVIDYMDAFAKGMERRKENAHGISKFIFNLEFKRLARYEEEIFSRFSLHTIITEEDKKLIHHKKNQQIEIVPNGIDSTFFQSLNKKKKYEIVFVGNMNYPPNVDACKFLVNSILPLLPKQFTVLIAGANPSNEVKNLKSTQVSISGWVEDIRNAYDESSVFVAPMRLGTGLQNKVLEAMSMNIPVITTPMAANGLRAKNGQELLICTNAEEFATQIQNLLQNSRLNKQLCANAHSFVTDNYNWDEIVKGLYGKITSIKVDN